MARAIVRSAADRGIASPAATGFQAIPGFGVQAEVEGRALSGGGPNLLKKLGVEPGSALVAFAEESAAKAQAVIYLIEGSRTLAAFAVADAVRPESMEAVRRLHEMKVDVVVQPAEEGPPVAITVSQPVRRGDDEERQG